MAIGNAVERNSFVWVYDESGQQTACIGFGGYSTGDGLKGYTSSTVNVQDNGFIRTYDEKGMQISVTPAG